MTPVVSLRQAQFRVTGGTLGTPHESGAIGGVPFARVAEVFIAVTN